MGDNWVFHTVEMTGAVKEIVGDVVELVEADELPTEDEFAAMCLRAIDSLTPIE